MKRVHSLARVTAAALFLAAGSALAADATVTGITVTPTILKPGDHISVTVQGKINKPGAYCTVDFLKGDGTPWSLAGNPTSFPFTFGGVGYPLWTYSKPGTYKITVRGGSHPATQCDGVVSTTIVVQAPAPKPIGGIQLQGKPVVMMGDPCPPGWHKTSGSAGSAFTCAANKPIQKIQCPPKTQYFETNCAIGCQQVIY
jgi:hypothetical protein